MAKPYKLADGEGLYLLVQPNGAKIWRQRYYVDGAEKLKSFGKYPLVTLAEAREKRFALRRALAAGEPLEPAAAPPVELTFEEIARRWHGNRKESLNPAHEQRVLSRMERDVFPEIGDRPIRSITAPDVLAMVRKIEDRGALDISRRANQCVGQVFRFAIANGWADSDPTPGLRGALKPRPRVQHMTKLPMGELAAFLTKLAAYDGDMVTRLALKFTLLTWGRTNETRFAQWSEFEGLDAKEPLWRIPADRMKLHREHLVPLSRQAIEIVKALLVARKGAYLFPGDRGRAPVLSQNALIGATYRMGYRGRTTVHGLRGLASTWANETGDYKADWVEMALSHGEKDEVRGAYNAALYLKPRRKMLQDWADTVERLESSADDFDSLL